LFKRTISLIRQAEQTGGEVGSVLDMTAQEVRRELTTRKEISAMLVTYEIFVLFAAVVGTPFLFSVVCKLLTILEKSFSYIPTTNQRFFGFIHPGSIIVSSQDFTLFSCFIIIITTLSSAAIISIIKHTRKTQAIKYFPFMLIAALGIFFLTGYILDSFMARFV
jgi:type II secretory pathway component PulF